MKFVCAHILSISLAKTLTPVQTVFTLFDH